MYHGRITTLSILNMEQVTTKSAGVSRKMLAKEFSTSEQTISSVLKRLVFPHIEQHEIERHGYFTDLGLSYVRELFSIQGTLSELGNLRKRFVLEAKNGSYAHLYKDYKPSVDMEIELPQPEPQLTGAITRYQQTTQITVETLPLPDFTRAVETQSLTRLQQGLYQMYYRKVREVAATVAATAIGDALSDTLADAEDALAFQLGEPS